MKLSPAHQPLSAPAHHCFPSSTHPAGNRTARKYLHSLLGQDTESLTLHEAGVKPLGMMGRPQGSHTPCRSSFSHMFCLELTPSFSWSRAARGAPDQSGAGGGVSPMVPFVLHSPFPDVGLGQGKPAHTSPVKELPLLSADRLFLPHLSPKVPRKPVPPVSLQHHLC